MRPFRVLVVDDEKNIRTTVTVCLEGMDGCESLAVGSAAAALETATRGVFDMAFVDLRLAGDSGLDLIPRLLAANPQMAVVVITAHATVDTVEAMRRGAWDYLPKPFTPAQIRHAVEKARERRALAARVLELEGEPSDGAPERRERRKHEE